MTGFSLLNQKGLSLVSQLLAVSAVLGAFLVLMAIMQNAAKSHGRMQVIALMVESEIRLISYFQNYDILKEFASEFKMGKFSSRDLVIKGSKIGRTGNPFFIDSEGMECSDPASTKCVIRIDTAVKCQQGASGSSCRAAYRISSLKDLASPLGASASGAFQDKDYVIPISYELSTRNENSRCDSQSHLFATGMSRDTGNMWCIRKPQSACAPGEISKGLRFNAAGNSLEPICVRMQTLRCPANYAVNRFSLSSLEAGKSKSGECVFVTKKEVPWKSPPAEAISVNGVFCPKHYKTKAACTVKVTSQWNGSCPYSCNCTKDGCSTCYSKSSPSNVGAYNLTQGVDQSASCAINPGTQSCGAGWSGVVQLTGTCVLVEQEKVGVL